MVTAFYIMNLCKNKKRVKDENHYSKLFNAILEKVPENRCRICLGEGVIPIYGKEEDLPEALATFGDVQISPDDAYTKYLCDNCYKFLKSAILFRKTAKQSEQTLQQPCKYEFSTSTEEHKYSNFENNDDETQTMWENDDSTVMIKKREKANLSKKVTCNICKKVVCRSYMKEHLTMHDSDHVKYVCEICGKSFRLRCAYHNHSLMHRTDFPYKCKFCPYKGKYQGLLRTHLKTHLGDYQYMCTECPARFLFKSNLNSHMMKHKEPQHKCDSCKRAFHTKISLQKHHEVDHLGLRNHVCSLCGKAFGYRHALMKHQRHVHKREKLMFGRMPSYLQAEQEQLQQNIE